MNNMNTLNFNTAPEYDEEDTAPSMDDILQDNITHAVEILRQHGYAVIIVHPDDIHEMEGFVDAENVEDAAMAAIDATFGKTYYY